MVILCTVLLILTFPKTWKKLYLEFLIFFLVENLKILAE